LHLFYQISLLSNIPVEKAQQNINIATTTIYIIHLAPPVVLMQQPSKKRLDG